MMEKNKQDRGVFQQLVKGIFIKAAMCHGVP